MPTPYSIFSLPLRAETTTNTPEEKKIKPKTSSNKRFSYSIVFGLLWILLGVLNILTRQYALAVTYFAAAVLVIVISYVLDKNLIRPRIVFGAIFVGVGILFSIFNGVAEGIFGFPAIFIAPFIASGSWAFGIGLAIIVGLVLIGVSLLIEKVSIKQLFTKKQLLPFAVSAILLFLASIAIISGIVIDYAVPATFVIIGVLVMMSLRRFSVTKTAVATLILSMLILSSAAEGIYTTTYVADNHYVTSHQVPKNVNIINLNVASAGNNINIFFSNSNDTVCQVTFLQPYGPVVQNNGASYYPRHSIGNVQGRPNVFNYTLENEFVKITAGADTNNINVTLNENFRANITAYSYFGDITIHLPAGANPIQSSNLKSQVGSVKILNS